MNGSRPAAAALIAANLLVVAMAFAFGWSLYSLLMSYWLELAIIGTYTLLKMAFASEKGELGKSRSYQGIFFIAHYATFVMLYAVLSRIWIVGTDAGVDGAIGVLLAFPIFVASHGLSFKLNYIDGKETAQRTSLLQMVEPYKRVLPVQTVVVVGAFVVLKLGESAATLAFLATAKLITDVLAHNFAHRNVTRPKGTKDSAIEVQGPRL